MRKLLLALLLLPLQATATLVMPSDLYTGDYNFQGGFVSEITDDYMFTVGRIGVISDSKKHNTIWRSFWYLDAINFWVLNRKNSSGQYTSGTWGFYNTTYRDFDNLSRDPSKSLVNLDNFRNSSANDYSDTGNVQTSNTSPTIHNFSASYGQGTGLSSIVSLVNYNASNGWGYRGHMNLNADPSSGGSITSTPIPGTIWLIGTGIIGLYQLQRRGDQARASSN